MIDLKKINQTKDLRKELEKELGVELKHIAKFSLDVKKIKNKNCENMIGALQIPLGIAGPCLIKGSEGKIKNYYLPLATTEGALVASVSRGCKATRLSGGINCFLEDIGTTRGPVFATKNLAESFAFVSWLEKNLAILKNIAVKTSNHLKLLKQESEVVGNRVFVRFYFDTQEAMGMNMVTLATQAIVNFIKNKKKITCLSLSGNYCIDKKPAWINLIKKRGKSVWAEAVLPKKIVKKVLKTTPQEIVSIVQSKCFLGSALSGSLGFNSHFSNITLAMFLATGQDAAHAVEASLGITWAQVQEDGSLYFSCFLPSLMVGSVGGGTGLETQQEALKILGLKGKKGDARKLAQIIGAGVLAGELSLLSALASQDLARAHQKLGKGVI